MVLYSERDSRFGGSSYPFIIALCGSDKSSQDKDILLAKTRAHSLDIEKVFGHE
jgi:hypothetical protein